jgi:hypothetical protein
MGLVRLNEYEHHYGVYLAKARRSQSIAQGCQPRHGISPQQDNEETEIISTLGEMAAAKGMDIYFEPRINTFKVGGDVGNYQVRTATQPNYCLPIRPADCKAYSGETIFVGVFPTDDPLTFNVRGWIKLQDAAQPQYWRELHNGRPPLWLVPQEDLRPIEHIKAPHLAPYEIDSVAAEDAAQQ